MIKLKYQIDFNKFIQRLLPPALRGSVHISWLKALFSPLQDINDDLVEFVDASRYLASVTGQSLSLESYLNDVFDPINRLIKIVNFDEANDYDFYASEGQVPDYDYWDSEAAAARYMYFGDELLTAFGDDFKVQAPASLAAKDDQIKANVNKYKIAGPVYSTEYL